MLDFKGLYWGIGYVSVSMAAHVAITLSYLNMPSAIDVKLLVFLTLLTLSLALLGLYLLWTFDTTSIQKMYAQEKLLADFLRVDILPAALDDLNIGNFIIGRLVQDILKHPNRWKPANIDNLPPDTKWLVAEFCDKKIKLLSLQAELEAQNGEVDGSAECEMRLRGKISQLETLVRAITKR